MRFRAQVLGSLFLLGSFFAAACSLDTARGARKELDQGREQWESQGLDDYRYTLRVGCFCPPEVTDAVVVEVRGGAVVSLEYAAGGPVGHPEWFALYDTVPELFQVIEEAIQGGADEIQVSYSPAYGFPEQITLDGSLEIADDELSLMISDFQVLD